MNCDLVELLVFPKYDTFEVNCCKNKDCENCRGRGTYIDWDKYEKVNKEKARQLASCIIKKDKIYFRFSYSDNDGSFFVAMEHGNLFRYMNHLRISHH